MSALSDKLAALEAKVADFATAQGEASVALQGAIDRATALIAAGGVSAEDLAKVDAISTALDSAKQFEVDQKAAADAAFV